MLCSGMVGYHFTWRWRAARSSEMLSYHIITWCHNPGDCDL